MTRTAIVRSTLHIDATGKSIGRLASSIALALQGKHKPTFVSHEDRGDFVEVRNASKVKITGNKLENKKYHHYSGYPGGMKSVQLKTIMNKNPAEAILRAVRGMLPKNRLRPDRLKRLKIFNE